MYNIENWVWLGLELGLLWCSMQLDPPLVIGDLPPRLTFPSKVGYYAVTESVERILLNITYKKDSLIHLQTFYLRFLAHYGTTITITTIATNAGLIDL